MRSDCYSSIVSDMVDIDEYADRIRPLLEDAKKAYGSRDADTPQHAASREYTRILVEFHDADGSLPKLAEKLGVAYAGIRRRVTNAKLTPTPKHKRVKYSDEEYARVVSEIQAAKLAGTEQYHDKLLAVQESGYSFARIAREMEFSSAFPLYYGADRARARRAGI